MNPTKIPFTGPSDPDAVTGDAFIAVHGCGRGIVRFLERHPVTAMSLPEIFERAQGVELDYIETVSGCRAQGDGESGYGLPLYMPGDGVGLVVNSHYYSGTMRYGYSSSEGSGYGYGYYASLLPTYSRGEWSQEHDRDDYGDPDTPPTFDGEPRSEAGNGCGHGELAYGDSRWHGDGGSYYYSSE